MNAFDYIQEATTKQLQRKQKSVTRLFPTFPDRVKGIAANGGIRLKDVEPELWHFKVASGTNKGTWYDVYLKFKNVVPTIQRIVMDRRNWVGDKSRVDRKKLARKFMSVVDVELKCSCPAFQYWGPAYILSLGKYNAKYTDDEKRPPRVRNPKQYGAYCKHLENLMKVLPFYNDTAMKWIEDFYEETVKETEQEAKEKYGWIKKAATGLKRRKEETEEEEEKEETKESVRKERKLSENVPGRVWRRKEAEEYLNGIQSILRKAGYKGTIIGSVAVKGFSDHDLDIWLTPIVKDADFSVVEEEIPMEMDYIGEDPPHYTILPDGKSVDFHLAEEEGELDYELL